MSTDTMYFNSSRRLPTHSKNNSPAIPAKNNSVRTPNKRLTKKSTKENANDIPLQQLPNGQKPDFGHGNGTGAKNNHNSNNQTRGKKGKKHHNHEEMVEANKSYENLTKNLKTLLINPEKTEKTVVETIIKSSNQNSATSTPPREQMMFSNGGMPQQQHQPGFISPISTPMNRPQQLNTLPHMIPSPLVQNNLGNMGGSQYLPYNIQQQQQLQQYGHNTGPQPIHPDAFRPGIPPMVAPQPPGFPGPPGPPGMPMGAPNMYMNQGMMPPPPNGFPPMDQHHNGIPSPTLPRIIPPNPIAIINPTLTSNPNDNGSQGPQDSTNMNAKSNKKSNKRNSSRKSKTFAGASFAVDVPNECSLPKPSFT